MRETQYGLGSGRAPGLVLMITCAIALLTLSIMSAEANEATSRDTLTIDRAIKMALEYNPRILAAQEEVSANDARIGQALVGRSPKVTIEGKGMAVQNVPQIPVQMQEQQASLAEKENATASISVRQSVYDGGRVSSAVAQARHTTSAATYGLTRTRQSISARTKAAYYNLLAAGQGVETAEEAVRAAEAHLAVSAKHFEARTAPQYDVLRAEVQVAEMRQVLIEAENGRDLARAKLANLIGIRDQGFEVVPPAPCDVPVHTLAEALELALRNRPEIGQLEEQLSAAWAARKNARAGGRPAVSGVFGYQAVATDTPFTRPGWNAALLLTFDPFDGGLVRHKVAEAEARTRQTEAEWASLLDQINLDVEQAYLRFTAASNRITVASKRVNQSEEAFRISRLRYDSGVGTAVEVADAQASLVAAKNELTYSTYDQATALAELELAVGAWHEETTTNDGGRR